MDLCFAPPNLLALLSTSQHRLAILDHSKLLAMTPPASPGGEGPTQAPPHLPPGWIAQWDANSKKYYYVQLSTGVSQWDIPTDAAPIGGTPAPAVEHPYGAPGGGQPELITHPDGSQTVKHADGRMEPVMPDENGNARGIGDGQTGDRGLGVRKSILPCSLRGPVAAR